ncbi:hypothetical protein LTR91_023055 [Friedmanniomyces endolithicus]|uniref:Cytochrome b561 domain-containing protein n=1 Tax=Friedmanniomyces endolithicus TaxID=329885 RepID=A0A4U0VE32_9PEZI|nr:hypothetical protein LTS09_002245 [Friedmanniomyces endolithicus]KAK0335142.1 hypothetical protein LTR94_013974 [Friedmanniomyces endolithicus]KAK0785588.1 hypothetical protein LTR38_012303 [Friedmanniomyces endolithicus]KAK0802137.1 hypothetical protein LTR59_005151 [Friedmanniomyces endolithicus]KAK0812231.1 hypothetical protein LTR75_004997 [Friedmanniomyces endolithicus]
MDAEQQQQQPGNSEQSPLLGGPGDATQQDKPLYYNFIIGTGVVAQAGAWILAAIVWGAVFSNDLILFSAHPLLNSAAVLFFIQAILILQPTHTAKQKKQGTYTHAALNNVALLAAVAGLVVIEYNKIDHGGAHFESPHAILGLITYIMVAGQALVGITQYFTPGLYGGVDNAKALYKYHRVGGYLTLLLMLATVCAATQTPFNTNVLQMQLWALVVASVLIVLGVGARIKPSKLGWLAGK